MQNVSNIVKSVWFRVSPPLGSALISSLLLGENFSCKRLHEIIPIIHRKAGMSFLDFVLYAYFLVILGMGLWARAKVKAVSDFITAGGAMILRLSRSLCKGGLVRMKTVSPASIRGDEWR